MSELVSELEKQLEKLETSASSIRSQIGLIQDGESPLTFRSIFEAGVLVRAIRTDRGLTLQELSSMSGISVSRISEIERGSTFRNDVIAKLLHSMGYLAGIRVVRFEAMAQEAQRWTLKNK